MRIFCVSGALVAALLAFSSCGGGNDDADIEQFKTLQLCFDEHANEEHLTVQQAIVVCCIDHPIGDPEKGEPVIHPSCGMSKDDCTAHVKATLVGPSEADEDAACQTYVEQLAM